MHRTILLAVDTTSRAQPAVDAARYLASGNGDTVVVLHVHEFAIGRFGRLQVDCADGEGEQLVDGIVRQLRDAGVDASADVRRTPVGHIARVILSTAEARDAWLIVLGSAGTRDVPRIPFGGVSLRLLHMSNRPVMLVPGGIASPVAAGQSAGEKMQAKPCPRD